MEAHFSTFIIWKNPPASMFRLLLKLKGAVHTSPSYSCPHCHILWLTLSILLPNKWEAQALKHFSKNGVLCIYRTINLLGLSQSVKWYSLDIPDQCKESRRWGNNEDWYKIDHYILHKVIMPFLPTAEPRTLHDHKTFCEKERQRKRKNYAIIYTKWRLGQLSVMREVVSHPRQVIIISPLFCCVGRLYLFLCRVFHDRSQILIEGTICI